MATPYYTKEPGTPAVYHDKTNCPEGKKIFGKNKVFGSTGGRDLCKECPKADY